MKRKLGGREGRDLTTARSWDSPEEDHCETPEGAYRDIEPLLFKLSRLFGKKGKDELNIYDPFFCEGAVRDHLNSLGFPNVHNVPEDFYEVQREGRIPTHDVLVTNPPFSGDHIASLLNFARLGNEKRPFMALLPNWVCNKQYFTSVFPRAAPVFFVVPREPYRFWAPGRREKKIQGRFVLPKAKGKEFHCIWFCSFADHHDEVVRWFSKWQEKRSKSKGKGSGPPTCQIALTAGDLPKPSRLTKRPNPRQRKAMAKKLKLSRG